MGITMSGYYNVMLLLSLRLDQKKVEEILLTVDNKPFGMYCIRVVSKKIR